MSKSPFPHLGSAANIGPMQLKNRFCMTAMGSMLANDDGSLNERIMDYYEARAKGGAALLTMGSVSVAYPEGTSSPHQVALSDDRYITGMKELADRVHSHGARLAAQLHHGGLVATQDMISGRPMACPSPPKPGPAGDMADGILEEEFSRFAAPDPNQPMQFNALTSDGIDTLIGRFADAAERAMKAGLDGVEIHGGHGYIISEFLSPITNRRDDEYGGSVENRARLLVRIIEAVKARVGDRLAVWCKIDSEEFLKTGGINLEDAKTTALLAQAAGADAITVSAYHETSLGAGHSASHTPQKPGNLLDNAAQIKALLTIPVISAGRVEPEVAEQRMAAGELDFIAMGRKLLADPELPNKVLTGSIKDVLPCIYCYTCISEIYLSGSVRCAVNPDTARECETITVTGQRRHIAVLGGGPAGMEAARRLNAQGHKVSLFEQSDRLGGTLNFAALAYEPNERLLNWLKRQIQRSNVSVYLKHSPSADQLRRLNVDAVVVATGGRRDIPGDITGSDLPHVFSGDHMRQLIAGDGGDALAEKTDALTRTLMRLARLSGITRSPTALRELSRLWLPMPEQIVIIGGELVGLELAEFLALRGRKVTVIDQASRFGKGLPIVRRWRVLAELKELKVDLIGGASEFSIDADSVSYRNAQGQIRSMPAQQVIVATGASGDSRTLEHLKAAGLPAYGIGDAQGIGYIDGAMAGARRLVVELTEAWQA